MSTLNWHNGLGYVRGNVLQRCYINRWSFQVHTSHKHSFIRSDSHMNTYKHNTLHTYTYTHIHTRRELSTIFRHTWMGRQPPFPHCFKTLLSFIYMSFHIIEMLMYRIGSLVECLLKINTLICEKTKKKKKKTFQPYDTNTQTWLTFVQIKIYNSAIENKQAHEFLSFQNIWREQIYI